MLTVGDSIFEKAAEITEDYRAKLKLKDLILYIEETGKTHSAEADRAKDDWAKGYHAGSARMCKDIIWMLERHGQI